MQRLFPSVYTLDTLPTISPSLFYSAPTEQAARGALEAFRATHDAKHPATGRSWETNWDQLTSFFHFPPETRKSIYTTNAIESLNSSFRRARWVSP